MILSHPVCHSFSNQHAIISDTSHLTVPPLSVYGSWLNATKYLLFTLNICHSLPDYIQGMFIWQSFQNTNFRYPLIVSMAFHTVSSDTTGPISPESHHGHCHLVKFMDSYQRYTIVVLIRSRSQVVTASPSIID